MDATRLTFSESVTFACPGPLRSALNETAARQFTHVSELVRRACVKELQAAGVSVGADVVRHDRVERNGGASQS